MAPKTLPPEAATTSRTPKRRHLTGRAVAEPYQEEPALPSEHAKTADPASSCVSDSLTHLSDVNLFSFFLSFFVLHPVMFCLCFILLIWASTACLPALQRSVAVTSRVNSKGYEWTTNTEQNAKMRKYEEPETPEHQRTMSFVMYVRFQRLGLSLPSRSTLLVGWPSKPGRFLARQGD